jgi:hypothetical protein
MSIKEYEDFLQQIPMTIHAPGSRAGCLHCGEAFHLNDNWKAEATVGFNEGTEYEDWESIEGVGNTLEKAVTNLVDAYKDLSKKHEKSGAV